MKILIAAQIDLEPEQRDGALQSARIWIEGALSQRGCLHYEFSPDPFNPARINVFEEWTDEEALAAHFAGPHYAGMRDHLGTCGLIGAASRKYGVASEGPVYGSDGKATPAFDEAPL